MFTGAQGIAIRLPRSLKAGALVLSLVISALLTAVALRSLEFHWLAWISFLPLFIAVRSLRSYTAAMAGGMWGGCLYVFSTVALAPPLGTMVSPIDPIAAAVAPSVWLLALMILIPAVYVSLAARPTWAICYRLLVLALGWVLLEVVLHLNDPSGPHKGLVFGSQGEGAYLPFARLLGYVCTAFLVACVNASLLALLSHACLSLPYQRSFAELAKSGLCPASQTFLYLQLWALRQVYPRGPPISVATAN